MGTWDSGTFENDAAMDLVAGVAEDVQGEIRYEGAGVEDLGQVLAAVAVLTALCEYCHAPAPEPQTVADWCDAHLALFDEGIDSLDPVPGHKEAVRRNIEAVFARLSVVAARAAE